MYDVIIIGAGPAGVSASLYTIRAGLSTLIIHKDTSMLKDVKKIENYYGFEEPISGEKLYADGVNQAKRLGVEFLEDEVLSVEKGNKFVIQTIKNTFSSSALILATGNKKSKLNIEGIDQFEGKGVSYCAICDGYFYKNKEISLIGSGSFAINELPFLLNVASKVNLLTNGSSAPELRAENLDIKKEKITKIIGDSKVRGVEFENGDKIKSDGIFIAEGVAGSLDFARRLGAFVNDKGNIQVDENMKTSIDGMYACGDATGGLLQISKAVYEGAKAGTEIIKYVRKVKEN